MLSALSNTQKGILYALLGFSAFVISDSCAKFLTPHYPILQIIAWTYLFSFLSGIAFSPLMGGIRHTLRTKKIKIHMARGLCNFGLSIAVVLAFKNLPLTSVYPVLFLSPFITTILAIPIYKEPVRAMHWMSITLGFLGVLIAFHPWDAPVNAWIIAAFIAPFFGAGLCLLARPLDGHETLLSLSFYPALVNILLLMPYSLIYYPLPSAPHLFIFVITGIMLTFGLTGVNNAFRLAPFALISPLNYTQLILAFIIGFVIFGEQPDLWMITGSVIIAFSGLFLVMMKKK